MTWLTRIQIDFETAAQCKLRDNYAWHQAMWEAFPGRADEKRSFLFRVDTRDGGPEVLLLSREQPSRPAWCSVECWSIKEIRPEFFAHRYYRFDLRANATRKVAKLNSSGERSKNGRRAVISDEKELRDWIGRKGEQGRFQVLDRPPLIIDPRTDYHFRKANTAGLHVGVRFRGAIEVRDAERFRETFQTGIGSAKAFGFGLLLLQPIQFINE